MTLENGRKASKTLDAWFKSLSFALFIISIANDNSLPGEPASYLRESYLFEYFAENLIRYLD